MNDFVVESDNTTDEEWAATQPASMPRRRRRGLIVAAFAAPLVLGALAAPRVVGAFTDSLPDPVVPASQTTAPVPAVAVVGGPSTPTCPASADGGLQRGAGPGSTDTAVGVVFAFQHAYWVDRSGVGVRAVTAPDAAVPAAGDIQRGIDTIPLGSTHCLAVQSLPDGRFSVELAYQAPGSERMIERQTVTVVERDGRFMVQAVES